MSKKVVIDAGHGLHTKGKRTPDDEREWSFNNKVAKATIKELKKYDVKVLRVDDITGKKDVALSKRVEMANDFDADAYVAIHHNASTGKWGNWTGIETFTYTNSSKASEELAKDIHGRVVDAYGLKDRGLKKANHAVTRDSNMPAILVEGGFMDSKIDIKKLRSDAVLNKAGVAIANGLVANLKLKKKAKPKPVVKVTASKDSYTVKSGDTLWGISQDTGISVANLKKYSNLKSDTLQIGQVLKLSNSVTHKVAKGDTLWGLSQKYDVAVSTIKSKNGLKSDVLSIGDVLKIK